MMYAVFLMAWGAMISANTLYALRSGVPAARITAAIITVEHVGAWFIHMNSQPPVRPVLMALMTLGLIIAFTRNVRHYKEHKDARIIIPGAFLFIILANLVYILSGIDKVAYSFIVDGLLLACVITNVLISRCGYVDNAVREFDGTGLHSGSYRNMANK